METLRREDRIAKITQQLKRKTKLHLKDAAALFGVSEMTIRRDINAEPSGITLLGGYIVSDIQQTAMAHYFVADQKNKLVEEKRLLGALAAELIAPNDTVFFDCGTTIPYLIDAIDEELAFTAICYSLNTFLALQDKPQCRVILCGGEFHSDNYIFNSIGRRNELDYFRPNKAFISAAGVSIERGATCFGVNELPMKQQAIESAQQVILVADHSKFAQTRPAHIGALKLFHCVVSDRAPDAVFADYFQAHGIQLIAAQ